MPSYQEVESPQWIHTPRRSQRNSQPPKRLGFDGTQGFGYTSEVIRNQREQASNSVEFAKSVINDKRNDKNCAYYVGTQIDFEDGFVEYSDPIVYAHIHQQGTTKTKHTTIQNRNEKDISSKDALKYHEALREPDWPEFQTAMEKEVATLESMETWM